MTRDAYPRLVLTGAGTDIVLPPVALASERNEAWLRDFLLAHPAALPTAELDPAYADPIPICSELRTPAGAIDAVFVNQHGALTLVECKLFRNPQARREVIAQILDYAKELARWGYTDFQAAVSSRTGRPGRNVPFETVAAYYPDLDEAGFVNSVSRNLFRGRFLLLIAGDGIRAETEAIAEYVQEHGALRFTLGLVEMRGFALPNGSLLVQPRLLARTREIERVVHRFADLAPERIEASPDPTDETPGLPTEERAALIAKDRTFWRDFARRLVLDDPSQPVPTPRGLGNARASLGHPDAWITLYRAKGWNQIGGFARFRGVEGRRIWDALRQDSAVVNQELMRGVPDVVPDWSDWVEGKNAATIGLYRREQWEPEDAANERHLVWLLSATNALVNALRPRVRALLSSA